MSIFKFYKPLTCLLGSMFFATNFAFGMESELKKELCAICKKQASVATVYDSQFYTLPKKVCSIDCGVNWINKVRKIFKVPALKPYFPNDNKCIICTDKDLLKHGCMIFPCGHINFCLECNVLKIGERRRCYVCRKLEDNVAEFFFRIGIPVFQGYGLTETSPISAVTPDFEPKIGSAGKTIINGKVKVDNPNEKGEGELLISTNTLMLGYYEDQEATDEVIEYDKDGRRWFHSGDIGYVTEDDFIYVTGRIKNVIVTQNGKNIYPEELETLKDKVEELSSNEEMVEVLKTYEDNFNLYDDAKEYGYDTGYDTGKEDGIKEGIKKGTEQGSKETTINLAKKMLEEKIDEELISKISRNSIVDLSRNSKINLSGITDNYGGSFGDFKDDQELSEEDLGVKAKKKLKIFIRILKRHLNSKNHPINIIITFFCQIFSSILDQQVEIFSKNKNDANYKERIKSFSEEITEDLKKFIIKIQTTVKLFYNKSINLDFFVEEKDELINLVTSIIFLKENIYKNIYTLFFIQFEEEVNDFKYKLNLMKNIKPIDLNIPNKLSLDENTSKEIVKMKEEFKKEKEEGIYEYINENDNKIFVPEDGLIKGFHNKNKIEGYNTVIKMLMGLKHAQTPFDKMILIASMSMEITQCVDTYWNNMDDYLPNYYLSINADEFLSLFILVVVRSQFPELIIHEKIIQKFTTKTTKSSTIGYYNVTLNAAIEYIQDEGAKEFKRNLNYNNGKKEYNSHLISKYLYQNLSRNEINDNNDEFILIDSKGKNILNNNNIINTSSNSNKSYNDIQKAKTYFNKKKKNFLGIEEDEEKNFELSIKNSDDD